MERLDDWSGSMDYMTYGCEHLFWIGIAEAAFVGTGYGGAKGGEEDNVIWVFLKDVFQSFLELGH